MIDEQNKPSRTWRDYVILFFKGMGMGAADVVPGVSGGTVAFITGIYDELLHALRSLTPLALVMLFKEGFWATWKHVNAGFLLAVFAGILLSFKLFAAVIGEALDRYPILVWSFFFGLIIASTYILARDQKAWHWKHGIGVLAGASIVVGISFLVPAQLPANPLFLFGGGFVAICAMILPGVSGSFLLMLMGLYAVVIRAVNDLDLVLITAFLLGCVGGLLVFSRFLSWLLDNYYSMTFSVLIGFLLGSLKVIWPWKHALSYFENRHGELIPLKQEVVLPATFSQLTGNDPMLLGAILSALTGILLVLLVEFVSKLTHSK